MPLKYGELITFVVPVFNRAHLIRRSVGSLCAQSYRNLEILVVDDCSTDDIAGAVADLDDSRVRLVIRAKNGGAAAARNTGVAEAKGELIGFHDSDDICVFDRVERQVQTLLSLPEDYVGVHCGRIVYTETPEAGHPQAVCFRLPPQGGPLSGDLLDATIRGNFISVPTMLLRRTALLAAGAFDEKLRNNEDWDFTIRLTRQGLFGFVPDPLYLTVLQPPKAAVSDHISFNDRYSAVSFVRITGKLRRSGVPAPDLAAHYVTAGRFLLRTRRPRAARRFLARAFRVTPPSLRLWILYALSHMPKVYQALQHLRR